MSRCPFPRPWSSPGIWRTGCAMAKTRINRRRSTASAEAAPGWRPRGSSRARSCPTTITATPTPPSSWSPSLRRRPLRSSSTPTHAARRSATTSRSLGQGARLRSGQRLRRHRRAQSVPRWTDRRGDRPAAHRSRDRPGGRRSSASDPRPQDGTAPSRHRRDARPGRRGAELPLGGRRHPGPGARSGLGRAGRAAHRDRAGRRARAKSPICCSPTRSQSTSNPTRSSSPAMVRRSASAPVR